MGGLIPHNRPLITAEDRSAVDAVLASGWLAQGPAVEALEASIVAQYRGGGACAVSSGTAALFLALKALGAVADSIVAMPTYACSALLNAVFMARAIPRVLDVLPDSFCLDPDALKAQAADARFVIAVHTFGAGADVEALQADGRIVIEDCCQSLGGMNGGVPLGAAGDAAVFSFYATKLITGGQGGLVWSRTVAEKVRDYRQFDGRETYDPRFNFQLTDLQAALANSQLKRLDLIRARRAAIAGAYLAALPKGLKTQGDPCAPGRMAHRFVVVAPDRAVRDRLRRHMQAAGVECIVPVERFELLHRYLRLDAAGYPTAEKLADTTLSLPLHLGLSDADVATISDALAQFKP
jgi:perosamine synthetase